MAGIVLVSPVACTADLIPPAPARPSTLVGRVLKPYFDSPGEPAEPVVERSRLVFSRMFEAGAQNRVALARLMSRPEIEQLHGAVMGTIRGLTARGAWERVRAFGAMRSPLEYFSPALLPLAAAPAPAGARRFLVIDVAPLTPALRSFAPLLRQARSLGCTLIVTCQSPSSLEPGLPALFTSHVAFYHFYKRCLRVMAENVLAATGAAETNPSGKPTPINRFGQPLATPVSRMVGKLGDLKVGECFLVTPGAPYEPLRT